MTIDSTGHLWVGTTNGLDRLSEAGGRFIHYVNDPSYSKSLSNNYILAIHEDRGGVLWFGTYGGGVNKYDRLRDNFAYYRHSPVNPNTLSGYFVFPIYVDSEGYAWIGTFGTGLNRLTWSTGQVIRYQHNEEKPRTIASNILYAIHEDRDGILWIGTAPSTRASRRSSAASANWSSFDIISRLGTHKMSRYLVTGGAGFIGSHIAETLVRWGNEVRVLDNLSTGKMENLAGIAGKFEFIEGDIRDLGTCRRAVEGVGTVFHEAALASVARSVEDPLLANAVNVTGTLNLLVAARAAGVRSFVLASSSAVYGDDLTMPKAEGREGRPVSPYGAGKLFAEKYAQMFHVLHGMSTVSLRYFNAFGPRQDPSSEYSAVIPLFVTKVLRGERPTIFGDGEQSRDFIHVDEVVRANLLAAGSKAAAGEAFNVACGVGTTVNGLLAAINEVLGMAIEARYAPPRPGDILHSTADISKAQRLTGF